jgi:hypothetical protein
MLPQDGRQWSAPRALAVLSVLERWHMLMGLWGGAVVAATEPTEKLRIEIVDCSHPSL